MYKFRRPLTILLLLFDPPFRDFLQTVNLVVEKKTEVFLNTPMVMCHCLRTIVSINVVTFMDLFPLNLRTYQIFRRVHWLPTRHEEPLGISIDKLSFFVPLLFLYLLSLHPSPSTSLSPSLSSFLFCFVFFLGYEVLWIYTSLKVLYLSLNNDKDRMCIYINYIFLSFNNKGQILKSFDRDLLLNHWRGIEGEVEGLRTSKKGLSSGG